MVRIVSLDRIATVGAGGIAGRPLGRLAAVYMLPPAAFAVVLGWTNAGWVHELPRSISLAYWFVACQLTWLIYEGATRSIARLVRPLEWRLLTVLVAGGIAALPLIHLALGIFARVLCYNFWPDQASELRSIRLDLGTMLGGNLLKVSYCIAANLVLVRLLGQPRFGFLPAAAAPRHDAAPPPPAREQPTFLERVRRPVGRLLALTAEQHYLRVVGDAGEALILYRISDAVRELDDWPGARVHRSHWVARDAVAKVERRRHALWLVLVDGRRVPVGRSFRETAASAGVLTPVTPGARPSPD